MPKKAKLVDLFYRFSSNEKGEADIPLNIPDFNGNFAFGWQWHPLKKPAMAAKKEEGISAPIVAEIGDAALHHPDNSTWP